PFDESQPTLTGLTSLAAAMQGEDESTAAATTTGGNEAMPVTQTPQPSIDAAANESNRTSDPGNNTALPPDEGLHETAHTAAAPDSHGHGTGSAESAGVQSLTRSITLTLGLIVAGVVLVTLIILLKSR